MTQESSNHEKPAAIPQAVMKTKKSFSIVWLVPLVAILIGGGLIYKAVTEKGPEITISFKSAEGLEAEKTKIKSPNMRYLNLETSRKLWILCNISFSISIDCKGTN